MDFERARFNMVEQQIRPWEVLDPKVLELFLQLPRHHFVPEDQQALAYMDLEVPLPCEQVMLPPRVEARMLQALDIDENETILEVGTGSGWMTSLLARLGRQVTTVEYFPELSAMAQNNLARAQIDNVRFEVGDAACDWQDGACYDVIVLTGATTEIPQAHLQKLTLGGRMICTTGDEQLMETWLITRVENDQYEYESLFETAIPALIHCAPKARFTF